VCGKRNFRRGKSECDISHHIEPHVCFDIMAICKAAGSISACERPRKMSGDCFGPCHCGQCYEKHVTCALGGVAEWLKAPVLKTGRDESPSWVQIPPPPPNGNASADDKSSHSQTSRSPNYSPDNVYAVAGDHRRLIGGIIADDVKSTVGASLDPFHGQLVIASHDVYPVVSEAGFG
jgi:hypothetical protein